ncbi:hypothetical protein HMPREF0812_01779 [Streptococcus agalactiae]|uniref:Uncharacterized protein n=1 Tax=Streptococcus agalactiae serotype V (strain ATCC BAA-611 / 2603 V/R) TaxID=208435 RepID=Q8DX83_STRA5|nr:hypothetical protein SAG1971 [Streptococcus agalactiae 2603V/R]KXA53630.1 hypothetical protein HMPREF1881_00097 [Streptococcus agalactiae]KXA54734.1 hypothetical protein HMPREF0812_01779 [Streptococcus agalactiae]
MRIPSYFSFHFSSLTSKEEYHSLSSSTISITIPPLSSNQYD